MAFTPTTFVPGSPPGISAPELNKFGAGIAAAHVTADGALQRSSGTMTGSLTAANTSGSLAVASGNSKLEVKSAGTAGDAAYMSFHRPGTYAAHFGLDTDNKWKVGGWSEGATAYELWHDNRLRVHSSGNYLEWLKGGSWQAMGGVISIPSDTIQQSFDTEYQKNSTDLGSSSDRRFLVAKFTPKFTGDVKLKVDIKMTNVLGWGYGIVAVGSSFRPSTSPSIYTTSLNYQTPVGTLLSGAMPSGSGGVTNVISTGSVNLAGAYATYEVILQVAEVVPLFVYFSFGFGSQSNSSDYIYIKNVRLCYDLI